MPYWDWSRDHRDLFKAPVFDPDPVSGLGENGACDDDCNIQTGALSELSHSAVNLSWPIPHVLRRNMTVRAEPDDDPHNSTVGVEFVSQAMEISTPGDYFMFQHKMTQIHNHIHNFVGGDLEGECPKIIPKYECSGSFTSNDPLFWLHHGQMDRIWWNWQMAHPHNFDAFHGFALTKEFQQMQTGWGDFKPNASVDHMLRFDHVTAPVHVSRTFNVSAPPFCYYYDDQEPPV
ncbi:hypothetical protein HGRIS_002044 [Hohenbuehelia grisea]|uniref:Tyrosinase copper-binding domain-containing protein n=1 Tax=Hohenbuehelia grisea TaxID=104357 RepID=A0ABR3JJG3_9AGAR